VLKLAPTLMNIQGKILMKHREYDYAVEIYERALSLTMLPEVADELVDLQGHLQDGMATARAGLLHYNNLLLQEQAREQGQEQDTVVESS
jgi:hypothetical protein